MNNHILFSKLTIEGCYLIKDFFITDSRGMFDKFYHEVLYQQVGLPFNIKEVFFTTSNRGTLRGIHFQHPHQQAKIVRCLKGSIIDLVVDLRNGSETFGKYEFVELNDSSACTLFVPRGVGHGYLVTKDSIVLYCGDEIFYSEEDTGIRWDDMDLNIPWPIEKIGGYEHLIISNKDKNLPSLQDWLNSMSKYVG